MQNDTHGCWLGLEAAGGLGTLPQRRMTVGGPIATVWQPSRRTLPRSGSVRVGMSAEHRALSADGIGFGIALGAAGIYFVMVGFGLLPMPGGEDAAHGPPAVIVAAGA